MKTSIHNFLFKTDGAVSNNKIFLFLLSLNLLLNWIFQESLVSRGIYHSMMSGQFENQRIDEQLQMIRQFNTWGYLLLPLIMWLKFVVVTLILQMPLMIRFIEIPFGRIFRVVMIASCSFIVMNIVYMIRLFSLPADEMNQQQLKVIPFSLGHLINIENYPESAAVMLGTFNIFEAGWLFLIIFGFSHIVQNRLSRNDIILLVISVWCFLLLLKYALLIFVEKVHGG